jgi:Transketolase, pyrimidine binding domain
MQKHYYTNSLKCSGDYQKDTPEGRYLRFGVREHGMAAICNGIFAYGGYRPFGATFLNFIGYAQGAVRLSALSRFGELHRYSNILSLTFSGLWYKVAVTSITSIACRLIAYMINTEKYCHRHSKMQVVAVVCAFMS